MGNFHFLTSRTEFTKYLSNTIFSFHALSFNVLAIMARPLAIIILFKPISDKNTTMTNFSLFSVTHHGIDEDDSEEEASNSRAQYVSANCVVFTHYQGDASSVVDEHFSRALDKTTTPGKGKRKNDGHFYD